MSVLKPKTLNLQKEKRFLILSTTGLGDTLWATPAIRALRQCFPTSYISIITSQLGESVLKHNRRLDAIFTFKEPSLPSLLSLYFQLKAQKITHVLQFHTSQRGILPLASLLGAREIIGSYGINKGLDCFLTQSLDNLNKHEIQRRLDIVAEVGAQTLDPSMEIFLGPEDEKEIEELFMTLNLPPYLPLVGIHPGAKDLFKRWPPPHFIELGCRLVQNLGCQILITGTPEEKALTEGIASQIQGAVAITHLSVLQTAALIKQMDLMITNDTGPMHLALAQQIPTLGLFTPTNPLLCGPYYATPSLTIAKAPTCTPCLKKRCKEPFCLMQIGVQEVYTQAAQLLHNKIR